MDPRLKSQEASALVRTLGAAGTNVSAFLPNTQDHMNSYIQDNVVVDPYQGSKDTGTLLKFKIPPYGFLKSAHLRVSHTNNGTTPRAADSDVAILRWFDSFCLLSEYAAIETLSGDGLWDRVNRMPAEQRAHFIEMLGMYKTNGLPETSDLLTANEVYTSAVPLVFTPFESSHGWLNARHVQDLQIHVQTNGTRAAPKVTVAGSFVVKLVCVFVRMSDTIEKAIFDGRYAKGGESIVAYSDTTEYEAVTPLNDTDASFSELRINLEGADTIVDLSMVLLNTDSGNTGLPWLGFHASPFNKLIFTDVQLRGEGRELFRGNDIDLRLGSHWGSLLDDGARDRWYGGGNAPIGNTKTSAGSLILGTRHPHYTFPLALSQSASYHTGSLPLQTMNDVYILLAFHAGSQATAPAGRVVVFARHLTLNSIDARTGRLRRRLSA